MSSTRCISGVALSSRLVEAAVPHLERSDAAAVVVLGTTSAFDTLPPTSAGKLHAALKAAVLEHASGLGMRWPLRASTSTQPHVSVRII